MKDIQIDSVIQADPDEITHLTNTGDTSSNINVMSHIMNKKNRSPDKEGDDDDDADEELFLRYV